MPDFRVNRRNLVQTGLVASILPLGSTVTGTNLAPSNTGVKATRLHKLLVDRSISESMRLGTYTQGIADEVFTFDGDLTRLWQDELRLQWPNGPRPIGGLTTSSARLVLEQLGRDHGARIVFSADHRRDGRNVWHQLVGNDDHLRSAELQGDTDWIAAMAKLMASHPLLPSAKPVSVEYTSAAGGGGWGDHHQLTTWILAPVAARSTTQL